MAAPCKLAFDDLWSLRTMGNLALSPDGRRVALVVHRADKASNERRSGIWLLFLLELEGAKNQLWLINTDAGILLISLWVVDLHWR